MSKSKYNGRRNDYFEHVTVDMPVEMKRAIERYGTAIGMNKSQVIREAVTAYLKEQYFPAAMNNYYNLDKGANR